MRKKLFSILALSIASISVIAGFSGTYAIAKTNKENISRVNAQDVDTKVNSVKEAIVKLANSKNYTIKVSTKTGPLNIVNNMYFTEDAFYDDYLGDEYGYCKTNDGVFKFDRYSRKFTPSSILKDSEGKKYESCWGNGFFYGFSDLDVSEFDSASGNKFDCSKKKNKLTFMKMFAIDQTKFPDVNAITIEVDGDINTLKFSVSLKGGEEHKCEVKDFGTTKIDYLEKQLATGKTSYKPDATISKIIDLFKDYNYTHFIYDEDFDKVEPVGYEKFTNDYFISGYTKEYLKENPSSAIKCSGMVGFKDYVVNDKVTLNGSYWTYLYGDSYSMVTSFYYNEDPYVPNVYNYPTFLEALSSSQYFESAGTEGTYFTNKISIISDFCSNFQLWEGLEANSFQPCGLFVKYDKSYHNQDTVTFSIQYDYYGIKGTTDYVFSDFNKTSEKVMQIEYAKKYVNAYYNENKKAVVVGDLEAKKFSIANEQAWLLDDNIVAKLECSTIKNAEAGSIISFKSILDTNELVDFAVTPDEGEDNNNYVLENGVYKIKESGNTSIILTKYKDGSWKFKASKL